MRRCLDRPHADIGENGRQPADYASHCWDELKLPAAMRPELENRSKPVFFANSNTRRDIASGER